MFPVTLLLFFVCLAWQRQQKKVKMKKQSSHKGLLIHWLLEALNNNLYKGLRWDDINKRIFCIDWTHKSAEHWSPNEIEVYRAWAQYKGKLTGKNEKQLKATFRCALNSKKELKEVKKTRRERFWQFINPPQTASKKETSKKGQKKYKETPNNFEAPEPLDIILNEHVNSLPSTSLAPSDDAEISRRILPPFESFCSFVPETPSHCASEISFNITGDRINHSPSPDLSRLTPPVDIPQINYHSSPSPNYHQHNTDVWRPNFLTIPHLHQNSLFNHLSFNDFDDFNWMNQTDMNQKLFIDNNKSEFTELDQFVPVMDDIQNNLVYNRQAVSQKTSNENIYSEIMRLDEDYLLENDVDPVACERLVQELSRLSPISEANEMYN